MRHARLLFLLGATALAAAPIRIQLVTGGHSHEVSFYSLFEGQRDYHVVVDPHPSSFRRDLRPYFDVLVLYDLNNVEGARDRENLRNFLEAGKGVVVLHHAIADNQKWPWWYEEVVGGRYLLQPEGGLPATTYKHDVSFSVRSVGNHAITEGIDRFQIVDEAYKGVWVSPNVRVLLETDNPLNDKPMAWISPYVKSRVVYIQLGHGREAHENPAYRKLVRNAILWAAGRLGP
jgi:type 1 glutamine amidotransferase